MKIKQEEVGRVCRLVLEKLKEKQLVHLKVEEKKVHDAMVDTFMKNLLEEEEIDEQARAIMEKNVSDSQEGLDRQRMYMLIKKKIAKERGFVL